jgi:hypothetical protein
VQESGKSHGNLKKRTFFLNLPKKTKVGSFYNVGKIRLWNKNWIIKGKTSIYLGFFFLPSV